MTPHLIALGRMLRSMTICGCLLCLGVLAACKVDDGAAIPPTLVTVLTTKVVDYAAPLSGVIVARVRTDLSFRIGGKISQRLADVGEHVVRNQVLARFDPQEQQAALVLAQADVTSADVALRQATAAFERQKDLLGRGNATRRDYDQAEASLHSAKEQVDQAHSGLSGAQDRLSYTELHADADGIITARMAEAGQVVAQAQPIYTLARDGPRDAVFNVPEGALANVEADKVMVISLLSDPAVKTRGDVREISPVVNPSTETGTVKVALHDTPEAMTLGALVNGTGSMKPQRVVLLPWSALFEIDGRPSVWVLGPGGTIASPRPITISSSTMDQIAVSSGLQTGEIVVKAGVPILHPGQKVQIVNGLGPTAP
jgi:membrane fusion protein, multidrug efflux system